MNNMKGRSEVLCLARVANCDSVITKEGKVSSCQE